MGFETRHTVSTMSASLRLMECLPPSPETAGVAGEGIAVVSDDAGSSAAPMTLEAAREEHAAALTAYAASLLRGDWDRARDVVQDAFVRLHRQSEREGGRLPSPAAALKSWLYTVTRNRAIDLIRKDKPMNAMIDVTTLSVSDASPDPAAAAERRDTQARLARVMDRLPANQREVIRLKFQADLSYREIAEVTELSVGNVGFLLHTGLKRLRTLMGESA